jgi:hypothetical protein
MQYRDWFKVIDGFKMDNEDANSYLKHDDVKIYLDECLIN